MNHFNVSLVKSVLRIIACYFLAFYDVQTAAIILAVAELLGIVEEVVDHRPETPPKDLA